MFTAPFFWGTVFSVDLNQVAFWPRVFQLLAPALLDVLNVYWAQKILYKLIKTILLLLLLPLSVCLRAQLRLSALKKDKFMFINEKRKIKSKFFVHKKDIN